MIEIPSLRPESRYGIPMADQMLFNREYIVGYSFLFRQARWAAEVIDPDNARVEIDDRTDTFRPDLRVPELFRADLDDYVGSGFDRGHLIASADRRATALKNSETFLLTNMSPQAPKLNRQIWRVLEMQVRDLGALYEEVYVICGPLFDVGQTIKVIGTGETKVPVPGSFFKTVLAEELSGRLRLWSFIFPNKGAPSGAQTKDFLVSTHEVERRSGLSLWDRLRDENFTAMKARKGRMWSVANAKRAREEREQRIAAKSGNEGADA